MDERVTALSQCMQLEICTGFIDGTLGIPCETFCIVKMCIDRCRSQYDNRDPRARAECTLQINYHRAGLFA
jgi:hypothetical protein